MSQDSDVDVGVLCPDTFFFQLPDGYDRSHFGISPASYGYATFKRELYDALVAHFRSGVTRGNKAITIRENSYHVEADIAPFFGHRRYGADGSYTCGVELEPDNGGRVINCPERLFDDPHWPNQHYENAVGKNSATRRRFKAIVRILKKLRTEMADATIAAAALIPGFLVECLTWNVPNEHFANGSFKGDVRAALAFLFNNTRTDAECSEWGEVSERKYLFRGPQPWTRTQAHDGVGAWTSRKSDL